MRHKERKLIFHGSTSTIRPLGYAKCQRAGEYGVHIVLICLSVAVRLGMSPELRLVNLLRLPKDGFLSTAL